MKNSKPFYRLRSVQEAIEKDKGIDDYQAHLPTVQYTQEEMTSLKQENMFTGYAIWGKPHIEEKILIQQLNISLHIIEFHEAEGGMEAVQPTHILITRDKVTPLMARPFIFLDKNFLKDYHPSHVKKI